MKNRSSDLRHLQASLPLIVAVASGFAGLGYQIVWTQQCALWLGHESAAVLAVVAAFFGGVALGALALGARIENSSRPVRWYAGCEVIIGLWGLLLIAVMAPFSGWMLKTIGAQPAPLWQWVVAFAGSFLLFLPATAAMGATLPAMERITAGLRASFHPRHSERSLAALYASNTFGAVVGVLAAAFWLVPVFGLSRTASVCVALNLICGVGALFLFPRDDARRPSVFEVDPSHAPSRARRATLRLAGTGFLGIGYEVVVVRVLSQVTEDTVYTFAALLAIYLVGSAVGAAGYQRWSTAHQDRERLGDTLLGLLAATCLIGTAALWATESVRIWALSRFGTSVPAALGAEVLLGLLTFGPPTVVMGAVFCHLSDGARAAGVSYGRALGVNTLGAATAPAILGVLVYPAIGPKFALLLIGGGYLALVARQGRGRPLVLGSAIAALALAIAAPPLAFIDVPPGGKVVSYRDGAMASVSVVEDGDGVARLRIDNRQQEGSSATRRVDGRQAWLPLLLHPAPRRALFLGLGTGVTAAAATDDPALEVDAVELLPEVISASVRFIGAPSNPRLHVIAGDARRYVQASAQRYDLIVSDNFHPARSGSGALYTVEHFAAVQRRLSPDGVFCQWLPLHQLGLDTVRSIVKSFLAVYPNGWAMIASNSLATPVLGLVARATAGGFDRAVIRDRVAALSGALSGFGLEDDLAVLGSFVAGPAALQAFAKDALANTDDHPVVAYGAPRITYAPDSLPRDRLIELLHTFTLDAAELTVPSHDPAWPTRLTAYFRARNQFIAAGRDVQPSANVAEMLVQVRAPLLAVLRASPDFRPAYDPLLAMALALARTDAPGATAILTELANIQPERLEAGRALQRIASAETVDRPRR